MWIILDGYNVIRQWPELALLDRADLEAGRAALVAALRAYRQAKGHRMTVVFDGVDHGDTAGPAGPVEVRYSRRGERADDVIARMVAGARGEAVVVVSSDREVLDAARRHRATGMRAEAFIERLEATRLAAVKGGEDPERRVKSGKGTARRLPKSLRRAERRLKDV
jgi:predicted RNA-binding protein with PIN domain